MFSINLLFNLNTFAATELYQWVDESGVKHFSQQPPAHIPGLKSVDVDGLPVVSGGESKIPEVTVNASMSEEPEPAMPEAEHVEKNARQCERAKRNIAILLEKRRIRTRDPETGELRYLDDEEKAAQLRNWQERENRYC